MKQYLCSFVNYKQDNWVNLLPMAMIAYNNAVAESTGVTPYFANNGRHPRFNLDSLAQPNQDLTGPARLEMEDVLRFASELSDLHEHLCQELEMTGAPQRPLAGAYEAFNCEAESTVNSWINGDYTVRIALTKR